MTHSSQALPTGTDFGRLLVVDDNESSRDILARRLAKLGYSTVEASGGQSALEQLEKESFDLILLDVAMPEVSGLEVLRSIRAERSQIDLPVIMVTALHESSDIVQALSLGANDYITKPVDFPVAVARIRTHLDMKRCEERRRESEERYALAVAGANDGIWDWDLRSGEIFYSTRWKKMIGCDEDSVATSPEEWFNRIHPEDRNRVQSDLDAHIRGVDLHFECEHRMLHCDGTYRWVLSRGLAIRQGSGNAYRIAGSQTDITGGKVSDPLTGLPNRLLFMDRLARLVERAKRQPGLGFAVMFLDIDHFKLINDSLGHLVGDQLLVALSRRVERNLRGTDSVIQFQDGTLARFGGDEFAILLDNIHEESDAVSVGQRLIESLNEPFHIAGREIFSNASIGVAFSGTGYGSSEELIGDADTAMYRAKSLGRGRVEVFNSQMRGSAIVRLALETELRHAVDSKQFQNWYQLIVSLETGCIHGVEALVRWKHPTRGIISPVEFIAAAEETGLILALGKQVLLEACTHMWAWQQRNSGVSPFYVSVNLSARQFSEKALVSEIAEILTVTGLDPWSLKVEITESMIMGDPERAKKTMHELKSLGLRIGIDDFGTGYSSLGYLHQFPLDILKIDQSFVTGMESNPEKLEIVRTIVTLAQSLNLEVIAEGVESAEQARLLSQMGCEFGQGYFFSRPVDSPALEDLIRANPMYTRVLS